MIEASLELLSDRLEGLWIEDANGEIENAKKWIDSVKPKHPFDEIYNQITEIDWDSCSNVLKADEKRKILLNEW
jgi:predicted metal-dependent hydrolase